MTARFPHLQLNADLREAVRALTSKFSLEYWEQHDGDDQFPEEFFQAFAKAGFMGVLVPEEYGGDGGQIADMCAILEEIAYSGAAMNGCSTVHIPMLSLAAITAFGTEQQKNEVLPAIASGELYVTFGVTEPDAGTQTTKIRTFARETEPGRYLINGGKVWNSGALRGDKIMVLTRTHTPDAQENQALGLTLFLTDLKADTVKIQPIKKIARNAVASAEVFFEDHPVRDEDIVGEKGRGFYHLLHSLNSERLMLASESLGMGRWALDAATTYAKERMVFDRPIGKNQAVAHPMADSFLKLVAAANVLYEGAEQYAAQGAGEVGTYANAAKYLASEAAFECADRAMQTFGGYSFAREYHIGRFFLESRLMRIAPVNNQMVLNYIAERELGLPRSY
ncbi:acyl-CoA dehydrogenase family protein [Blastococcus sp. Marseille-P5729]|uniref:acyl-CoA dehydrogenase family protein n=1 Tax=Blastococcus sp. Marseille-P5729 TaxID=2086582 RepID=UPI000D0FD566|nr:acyl-CoA dehydrogenase family protein [Blastococcus sp. Marseille-P5729]